MIPVFEPHIGPEEIEAVVEALKRGELSGSFGKALAQFEAEFAEYIGCKHGLAVTSGTTALHLAVAAAGISFGDEVLLSACTNIATALAVVHNGAIPVPVDSEPTTWNLDLDLIETLITPKTKAIIPVHIYGHPVDMDKLMKIAARHNLIVIEDCAESHGATCKGRMTGSFGQAACFSFYANKVITTGEGGMIVTNDDALADRVRLLRNLAFTTPRFRHEVAGYNFRMTSYQAAMGLVQLRKIESIIAEKRRIALTYTSLLHNVPALQLPTEMPWARNVYWMYAVALKPGSGINRDELTKALLDDGIETRTFFCPMNLQPCLQSIPGFRDVSCSTAEHLWQNGFYLPSSHTLTRSQIEMISTKVVQRCKSLLKHDKIS